MEEVDVVCTQTKTMNSQRKEVPWDVDLQTCSGEANDLDLFDIAGSEQCATLRKTKDDEHFERSACASVEGDQDLVLERRQESLCLKV